MYPKDDTQSFNSAKASKKQPKWGLPWWPSGYDCFPNAGGPSQGTRSHKTQLRVQMLQLKIRNTATKNIPHVAMKMGCAETKTQHSGRKEGKKERKKQDRRKKELAKVAASSMRKILAPKGTGSASQARAEWDVYFPGPWRMSLSELPSSNEGHLGRSRTPEDLHPLKQIQVSVGETSQLPDSQLMGKSNRTWRVRQDPWPQ